MTDPDSRPHSRNLRLHRQMEGPGTFFVTKCLEPRNPAIDDRVACEVCSALCFYAEKKLIYLPSFVVMLDHYHVLLATCDGRAISSRMKTLGRWISKQTQEGLSRGCGWQTDFMKTKSGRPSSSGLLVPISRRTPSGRNWSILVRIGNGRPLIPVFKGV